MTSYQWQTQEKVLDSRRDMSKILILQTLVYMSVMLNEKQEKFLCI